MKKNKGAEVTARLLAQLLAGEHMTATQAGELVGLKRTAAKRHLDALTTCLPQYVVASGTPLQYSRRQPEPCEAQTAVLALALARAALPGLRESVLDDQLMRLQEEQQAKIGVGFAMVDIGRRFVPRHSLAHDDDRHAATVDKLFAAVSKGCKVSLRYQHFGLKGGAWCTLLPYSLVPTEHGLFCLAMVEDEQYDRYLQEVRMFKIARMSEVVVSKDTFSLPPADRYDPNRLFAHSYGVFVPQADARVEQVVLEFAPRWGGYLGCERLHPSQDAPVETADGWWAVRLELYLTLDLVQWLRGLGKDVRVLNPARLEEWIVSGEGPGFRHAG